MKTTFRNHSIHHRQEIKAHLHQLVVRLRDEAGHATAPKSQSEFGTSAEDRPGLVEVFDEFEKESEAIRRVQHPIPRPGEGTTHAPRR